MPFSQSRQISAITGWLEECRPASILDVGAGIGLYGLLARIYLDGEDLFIAEPGNVRYRSPADRKLRVEGIEGFAAYRNPVHDFAYDALHIGEALAVLATIRDQAFEVVLAIDILEHYERRLGEIFVRELFRVASRAVLISTPKTFAAQNVEANPLENHRSHWTMADLRRLGCRRFLADSLSWLAIMERTSGLPPR